MTLEEMKKKQAKDWEEIKKRRGEIAAEEKELTKKVNDYRKRLQANLTLHKSACFDLQESYNRLCRDIKREEEAAKAAVEKLTSTGAGKLAQPSPKAQTSA